MTTNAEDGGGRRRNRWRIVLWGGAALILLLPWLAMQFTDEVVWDVADFVVFGALLSGAGVTYELAVRLTGDKAYRSAVAVALAAGFILVWVNLAVGVIGSENSDANLMFAAVLAIGVVGAVVARFEPDGMSRALFATAIAQLLVAVIALAAGFGSTDPIWPLDIVFLTLFFTLLWLLSGALFRKAAREQLSTGAEPGGRILSG